jgi:hypothetical protein
MLRIFSLALLLSSLTLISCNRSAPENTENAREQAVSNSDSMPQDHTGVSGDSTKNTPGMNIGK